MLVSIANVTRYINRPISTDDIIVGSIYLIILLIIIYIIGNISSKTEDYIREYAKKFLEQFKDDIEHVPCHHDIDYFLHVVKYKNARALLKTIILIPLIKQKLIFTSNMNILDKYILFYKRNINEINFGHLSMYSIYSDEIYDFNGFLKGQLDINTLLVHNHMEIKYKNEHGLINSSTIPEDNNIMLILYINQTLILQEILQKAFLEDGEYTEYVKNDVIKEFNSITNTIVSDNMQLLFEATIANIIKNKAFKEIFINTFENNKAILDIINKTINNNS